ncbi:rhamnogalacturonan acetylesterase [Parvularcula sp. LCG005]|uniref:rhamnogalacturonan acetylesterase n=1 Tax=Parvularcula sp. LCG005 TaxID=3078805 RepID=UPI0029433779|nr:rhamnogalacturonan acetylesterase [Parvularcula sp. LCG005]WOI54555.1 rhamnogalacturonan acetylesterase [Parvularcula sp. LCG005]
MLFTSIALAAGAILSPMEPSVAPPARIIIAGDSTAADYAPERAPQTGWGQALRYFAPEGTEILNLAANGRSTKSYRDEGRWAALLNEVQEGDTVLISFGHNDQRDDAPERYAAADGAFRENLVAFATEVQARGGRPIILSSAARRLWEGPAMVETHGLYRVNAERAAGEAGARYIDLAQLSLSYFETIGRDETKADFLWLPPDPSHVRFPEGVEDNTHFSFLGACGVALIVARELNLIAEPGETEGLRPMPVEACAAELSQ